MAERAPANHWNAYNGRWDLITPPLRPPENVTHMIAKLADIQGSDRVLMWGVTPELAARFHSLEAIDKSKAMVSRLRAEDPHYKTAVVANWFEHPTLGGQYKAVVGDGSLNAIGSADELRRLLAKGLGLLVPGGRIVCRVFVRPTKPHGAKQIGQVIKGHKNLNFHAFKWMIAMHVAETQGASVKVAQLLDLFNTLCPNRDELAHRTGWTRDVINTIDVYHGSTEVYFFPSQSELVSLVMDGTVAEFHECGGYDLSDCCPIVTIQSC